MEENITKRLTLDDLEVYTNASRTAIESAFNNTFGCGAIKKINDYKFDINDYLDILSVWYRDVLLFKATNDVNHLIFRDEIQYIKKTADQSAYEGIEEILDALEKAKARLKANVNFDLTMELLLLTIKEN